MDPAELSFLWKFLVVGYLFTVAVEAPVLVLGLSPRHPLRHRLFAGVWLTACTYPVVVLVLPQFIDADRDRTLYLAVAETFAPVAECALFWAAFGRSEEWLRRSMWRDFAVVTLANLLSFGAGELAHHEHWLPEPPSKEEKRDDRLPNPPEEGARSTPREVPALLPSFRNRPAARVQGHALRGGLQICKVPFLGMHRLAAGLE
jgi:hypothetical protein